MFDRYLLILLTLLTLSPHAYALEEDESKAVILAYHRVGDGEYSDMSITTELFDEHLNEMTNGAYNILPLPEVINALKNKTKLPPKTIAITFEGSYRSTYNNAIQKLIKQDIPFTIFIASETTSIPNYMDWKILKRVAKFDGASFGILPASYTHISQRSKQETTRLINRSRLSLKDNLGTEAQFFAYPYGEISNTLTNIAAEQGFEAAFGLHSGPAHSASNMLALPRFSITTPYADIDRFRMITTTQPLPAKDIQPNNWMIETPITQIGFTAPPNLETQLKALSCHIAGQSKPNIEILGNRVEIIPSEPISEDRTRLNCTLPNHSEDQKQWRWLGMLFHTPHQD